MSVEREHSAAADSWFSHLAVEVPGEVSSNKWLEGVAEETYAQAVNRESQATFSCIRAQIWKNGS